MILIQVKSSQKVRLAVNVFDQIKPHTYYSHEKYIANGVKNICIRLPLVPAKGFLEIYNTEANRDSPEADFGFEVLRVKHVPLKTNLDVFDSKNETLLAFVKFAEEFSERAAFISTKTSTSDRSIYTSPDGNFVIHFVDEIIGDNGEPRRTSMRVNNRTGVMELAKIYICKYTIPERIAILLHEFSHFYLNKNHKDEFEADRNALMIYCGLGYPRKQAYTAFHKVFYRSPSQLNISRMNEIKDFLKKFDKTKFDILN